KYYRAARTLKLTVKRYNDIATIDAVTGTEESGDGRVVAVFMRQGLGKKLDQVVNGTVEGNRLHTIAEGKMQFDKFIPWNKDVVGAYGELKQIETKKPQPGAAFDYLVYEPIINAVVRVRVKVGQVESVIVAGQSVSLLKITAVPDEIQ